MNRKMLTYLVLITATMTGAAAVISTVYNHGSSAVPQWSNFVSPGELSARHAFLAEKCETCHTPLRGVSASACIACHATNTVTLARQSTAFHATVGSCTACHIEHQNEVRPTQMQHDALIAIGREKHQEVASPPDAAHASNRSQLYCFECHSNKSPHRDLFGVECAACHVTSTWQISSFQHPSQNSTDCAQCHQAPPSHYMGHFEMVSKIVAGQEHARVEQCHLCHQTDSWNEIRGVGWYKHH